MKLLPKWDDGCFGIVPCFFCWLEHRRQKKMQKDGYWPTVNKK